jgi:2-C-methyl-D-erythritol 2,4-cyclodiphosphate synthase
MFKVGLGQDSHVLKVKSHPPTGGLQVKSNKNLILGGVEVSKDYYLEADSDGDVIIHSLCNALSSAIGGGSLDTWAGPMFKKGITDSRQFLAAILQKLKDAGYSINNISVAVEAKQPKLEQYRIKMQQTLASLLGLQAENMGISFTTGEGLTAFGRGEAIQAFTVALIQSK